MLVATLDGGLVADLGPAGLTEAGYS